MDKIIVYVDDADHAQQLLAPLVANEPAHQRHWVLVACAPRMTHRVSKWVSHSARESWRNKWADKLFAQIIPGAGLQPSQVTTVLAKIPLAELTEQLQSLFVLKVQSIAEMEQAQLAKRQRAPRKTQVPLRSRP